MLLEFATPAMGKHNWLAKSHPEALARLAPWVLLLLIILIAHSLAQLIWLILTPATGAVSSVLPLDTQGAPDRAARADVEAIVNWHLFGKTDTPVPPAAPVKAPETKLNLRLAGILYSNSPLRRPLALIAEGDNLERNVGEGEFVSAGVRVREIARDHVILTRNGRPETLSLPRESKDATGPAIGNLRSGLGDDTAVRDEGSANANPNSDSAASIAPTIIKAGAILGPIRESLASRPEALSDIAFVEPISRDGRFLGFHIKTGRNRRLLGQLGLRQGDIVTEVNGAPLSDPSQGIALMQELVQANQVQIKVLRNGTEVPLNFLLNE